MKVMGQASLEFVFAIVLIIMIASSLKSDEPSILEIIVMMVVVLQISSFDNWLIKFAKH